VNGKCPTPFGAQIAICEARAEPAKSNQGVQQIMANAPKPVKKAKKLESGKRLEKKTTLSAQKFLTRFPVS
jgi:hypothetical protein